MRDMINVNDNKLIWYILMISEQNPRSSGCRIFLIPMHNKTMNFQYSGNVDIILKSVSEDTH